MTTPNRKISVTLLEFGAPLLDLLDEPRIEEFRAALSIVIVIWNAHALSMAAGGDHGSYLDELARCRQRLMEEGAPAVMLASIDALSARRVSDYADDPRCVGEWDLRREDAGGYTLRCEARLPGRKETI